MADLGKLQELITYHPFHVIWVRRRLLTLLKQDCVQVVQRIIERGHCKGTPGKAKGAYR